MKIAVKFDLLNNQIEYQGQQRTLAPIASRLLNCFLENPNKIISRQQLAKLVWQSEYVSDDAINQAISLLRRGLGKELSYCVKTIKSRGYLLNDSEQISFERVSQPADIDFNTAQPITINHNQTTLTNWRYLYYAAFCSVMLMLYILYWSFVKSNKEQTQPPVLSTAYSQKTTENEISIKIVPAKTNHNIQQYPLKQIHELNRQFTTDITRIKGIKLRKGEFEDTDYTVILHVGHTEQSNYLYLDLLDHNQQYILSTKLTLDILHLKDVIANAISAINLATEYRRYDQQFLSLYPKVSYVDLEQLAYIYRRGRILATKHNQLINQQLLEFEQKYPDVAMVYAIQAWQLVNTGQLHSSGLTKIKQLADKALKIDQTNLIALLSLIGYYSVNLHERHHLEQTIEYMLIFHPKNTKVWQRKLNYMVRTKQPCNKIARTIAKIPQDTYTPRRLNALNNLIDVCLGKQNLAQVIDKYSHSTNRNEIFAILRNLYFMEVRYDGLEETIEQRLNQFPSPYLYSELFAVQLAKEDLQNAQLTFDLFRQPEHTEFIELVRPLAAIYGIKQTTEQPKQSKANYIRQHAIYRSAELIVTQQRNELEQLMAQLWPFEINLINRYEAIAVMVGYHYLGQHQQSQQIARALFEQLDLYLKTDPQSFHFWALGWLQLAASYYCDNQCNTDSLSIVQLFNQNDSLWFDHVKISQVVFGPWIEDPLIIDYLNHVERSRKRARSYSHFIL